MAPSLRNREEGMVSHFFLRERERDRALSRGGYKCINGFHGLGQDQSGSIRAGTPLEPPVTLYADTGSGPPVGQDVLATNLVHLNDLTCLEFHKGIVNIWIVMIIRSFLVARPLRPYPPPPSNLVAIDVILYVGNKRYPPPKK